jgi:hypothetical protein
MFIEVFMIVKDFLDMGQVASLMSVAIRPLLVEPQIQLQAVIIPTL